MSNNTSLQQYKEKKLAELKALIERINTFIVDYGSPTDKYFDINHYRGEVGGWVKQNMDKLCRSKQDVDIVFNWKEAEYQNILLNYRKKKKKKLETFGGDETENHRTGISVKKRYNNSLAADYKKYSDANVKELYEPFRGLQNREFVRVQKERKAARNSKKARNSSRSGVSTSNRVKSIRNATASAAAQGSAPAQASSTKHEQKGRFLVVSRGAYGRKIRRRGTKRRQAKRGRRGSKKR